MERQFPIFDTRGRVSHRVTLGQLLDLCERAKARNAPINAAFLRGNLDAVECAQGAARLDAARDHAN